MLAKQFGAAIVCLEHRYYGESSPFEELTSDNLKYLSSKQALFDLAAFRNFIQVCYTTTQPFEESFLCCFLAYQLMPSPWSGGSQSLKIRWQCPCVGEGDQAVQQDNRRRESVVCFRSIVSRGFECVVSVEIPTSGAWESFKLRRCSCGPQLHCV